MVYYICLKHRYSQHKPPLVIYLSIIVIMNVTLGLVTIGGDSTLGQLGRRFACGEE